MTTVTEDMVGRRVRITRSECIEGPAECGSCSRAVGQEGVVTRSRVDSKGVRLIVGDHGFVREVELLDEPAPVGFELGGRRFVPGEQYRSPYNGVVTVLDQDDPEYLRFNGGSRSDFFVPIREANGRVNGIAPNALTPVTTPTTTQENTTMTNPTFSADQQQFLREVVGRIGEQHRACAVAAQALRELGVEQPQLTTEAVVTITLRVPLANSSGQVQLPPAPARGYLGSVVDTTTLNRLADRLISDVGDRFERRGDATAEITNVAS